MEISMPHISDEGGDVTKDDASPSVAAGLPPPYQPFQSERTTAAGNSAYSSSIGTAVFGDGVFGHKRYKCTECGKLGHVSRDCTEVGYGIFGYSRYGGARSGQNQYSGYGGGRKNQSGDSDFPDHSASISPRAPYPSLGSPGLQGEGFKTLHGQHRPDWSLSGNRTDRARMSKMASSDVASEAAPLPSPAGVPKYGVPFDTKLAWLCLEHPCKERAVGFRYKFDLDRHVYAHHRLGAERLDCGYPSCPRKGAAGFIQRENMIYHERTVHGMRSERSERQRSEELQRPSSVSKPSRLLRVAEALTVRAEEKSEEKGRKTIDNTRERAKPYWWQESQYRSSSRPDPLAGRSVTTPEPSDLNDALPGGVSLYGGEYDSDYTPNRVHNTIKDIDTQAASGTPPRPWDASQRLRSLLVPSSAPDSSKVSEHRDLETAALRTVSGLGPTAGRSSGLFSGSDDSSDSGEEHGAGDGGHDKATEPSALASSPLAVPPGPAVVPTTYSSEETVNALQPAPGKPVSTKALASLQTKHNCPRRLAVKPLKRRLVQAHCQPMEWCRKP